MDIPLILDKIRPNAKWRNAGDYQALKNTWEDGSQSLPSSSELDEEWVNIQNNDIPKIQAREYLLKKMGIDIFRMVYGIYKVGVQKSIWDSSDFPIELKSIALEWKQKLDILYPSS